MSADRSTLADLMTPPRPEAARFDLAQNAWVLSRYPDVWAALREPYLWPVSGKREIQPESRDADGRLKQRAAMLEALSASRLEEWRPRLEALTHSALDRLPTDRAVDLFGEFTLPWGLALAMLVTGADAADSRRLADLGGRVFAATGESEDAALRADAASATAELERIFETGPIPMGEPAFVALSQTLPRLLANAWLALVRHPTEFAHLRAHPELMPGAIEELLRYAGIVRRVFRRATAKVDLGGVRIAEGELAVLMLASAKLTVAQVRAAVGQLKQNGIRTGMFFMWGYEGEELSDIEATYEQVKACQPDVFFTTISYPIKGTPYYDEVAPKLVQLGPWQATTDRDIKIRGRRSRRFYQLADQLLRSETPAEAAQVRQRLEDAYSEVEA